MRTELFVTFAFGVIRYCLIAFKIRCRVTVKSKLCRLTWRRNTSSVAGEPIIRYHSTIKTAHRNCTSIT